MWYQKIGPSANADKPVIKDFIRVITADLIDDADRLLGEIPDPEQLKKRLEGVVKDYAHQIPEDMQRAYLIEIGEMDEDDDPEECEDCGCLDCQCDKDEDDDDVQEVDGVRFRRV